MRVDALGSRQAAKSGPVASERPQTPNAAGFVTEDNVGVDIAGVEVTPSISAHADGA